MSQKNSTFATLFRAPLAMYTCMGGKIRDYMKYFFSVVDVVGVLTEQDTARGATIYWAVVKKRLKAEGADELITNCKQLKMPATDGKMRLTDAADLEQILRIVQSIPSKKAEPMKRWLGLHQTARRTAV